jgi:prephenate dehydratase
VKRESRDLYIPTTPSSPPPTQTEVKPLSNTPQAALSTFPAPTHTLAPSTSIADVFSAVQSRSATAGVVPFENSSNGSVVFTLDLFADRKALNPDVVVCGEVYVPVRHCLLGHRRNDNNNNQQQQPSSTNAFSHVKKLYSHPQAWGQCVSFLHAELAHAERFDVSSTSRAAQVVADDASGESAAVSSAVAAEVFGLDVLREGINDSMGNATRFLVLRRRDDAMLALGGGGGGGAEAFKTLLHFTLPAASTTHPGALADALSVFSAHGLSLTSINTRPSGVANWDYVFFVEIRGRREDGGGGAVDKALEGLKGVCGTVRWLGSWRSAL